LSKIHKGRTIPVVTTQAATNSTSSPLQAFRLSPYVTPQKYELLFKITDFDPFDSSPPNNVPIDYRGEVKITFDLTQSTNRILVHIGQSITLNRTVTLESVDTGLVYSISHGYFDASFELYQVRPTSTSVQFPVGKYRLSFSFLSETQLDGFFKSSYVEFGTTRLAF
jgi:hypothetical protein